MKLVFLPSTVADLAWMKSYYEAVFPQGAKKARVQYLRTKDLIKRNPFIGQKLNVEIGDIVDTVREFPILKTPFRFIYRVKDDQIEVLRIWDNRRDQDRLRF